jgi:uncharacterized lipoprotein NlpE involved in copper resistance
MTCEYSKFNCENGRDLFECSDCRNIVTEVNLNAMNTELDVEQYLRK